MEERQDGPVLTARVMDWDWLYWEALVAPAQTSSAGFPKAGSASPAVIRGIRSSVLGQTNMAAAASPVICCPQPWSSAPHPLLQVCMGNSLRMADAGGHICLLLPKAQSQEAFPLVQPHL